MKTTIAFEIDTDSLHSYDDSYLAQLWHIAQANGAPIEDRAAGKVAEHIGREIVRRWLASVPPALWNHQGRHADWCVLHLPPEQSPESAAAPADGA